MLRALITATVTILGSTLLHAGVYVAAREIGEGRLDRIQRDAALLSPDRWVGTSAMIEVSATLEPSPAGGDTPPASPAPAAPSEPAPPSEPQVAPPPTPPPAASSAAATAPAVTAHPESKPRVAKAKRPKQPRSSRPKRSPAPSPEASSSASAGPVASAAPSSSPGDGEGGGKFGAEGQAAVRDLGRAFTRAIPAACSGDPEWAKGASGDVLSLVAELRVNAEGHLGSMEPMGKEPPKALVNLLRRTLPLLQAGTFAVQGGTVSAGVQTVELKATLSDEGGGEAPAGGRDNLAFSYSGGRGKASFTLTSGRRVDIAVRVVKVEVTP